MRTISLEGYRLTVRRTARIARRNRRVHDTFTNPRIASPTPSRAEWPDQEPLAAGAAASPHFSPKRKKELPFVL